MSEKAKKALSVLQEYMNGETTHKVVADFLLEEMRGGSSEIGDIIYNQIKGNGDKLAAYTISSIAETMVLHQTDEEIAKMWKYFTPSGKAALKKLLKVRNS